VSGQAGARVGLPSFDPKLLRLAAITCLIFLALSVAKPDLFPTPGNIASMSVQFPEIGILSIAIMLTLLTGGIDLSVTAIGNLSGIVAAYTLQRLLTDAAGPVEALPWLLVGVLVALGVGLACGLLNGMLITVVGITPILSTLGTLTLYTGLATAITGGTAVFGRPQFQTIGSGAILGVPIPPLIFAALVLIFSIVLNRTSFGFKIYMLGTNPTASRFSGINNARVLIWTYALSGLLGAMAGLMFLARNNSAKADYGSSYILQAILVAILGGINPAGGFGKISGLVLAILSLQFLSTGLNMLLVQYSGSNFFKEFAWGALLLLVMVIDYIPGIRFTRGRRPGEVT